jgi:hypothetical protein
MISLLAPIFYAGKDTRTPVTAALCSPSPSTWSRPSSCSRSSTCWGLAFAIGLGAWAEVIMLVTLMERRIGFDLKPDRPPLGCVRRRSVRGLGRGVLTARFMEQHSGGPRPRRPDHRTRTGGLAGMV